jgi:hypothetical protein
LSSTYSDPEGYRPQALESDYFLADNRRGSYAGNGLAAIEGLFFTDGPSDPIGRLGADALHGQQLLALGTNDSFDAAESV